MALSLIGVKTLEKMSPGIGTKGFFVIPHVPQPMELCFKSCLNATLNTACTIEPNLDGYEGYRQPLGINTYNRTGISSNMTNGILDVVIETTFDKGCDRP
jgi:hypothetical protein